jgi:hypothetical protein
LNVRPDVNSPAAYARTAVTVAFGSAVEAIWSQDEDKDAVTRFTTACRSFIGSRDMISSRTICARADVALDVRTQTRRSDLRRVDLIRNLHRI